MKMKQKKMKTLLCSALAAAMLSVVPAGITGFAAEADQEIVLADYRNIAPGVEDAYYCSVILYVWEPLITMDEKGEPVGKLAKNW